MRVSKQFHSSLPKLMTQTESLLPKLTNLQNFTNPNHAASQNLVEEILGFTTFWHILSAKSSRTVAAAMSQLARGGHTPANRGAQRFQLNLHAAFCVGSALASLIPARQFSG